MNRKCCSWKPVPIAINGPGSLTTSGRDRKQLKTGRNYRFEFLALAGQGLCDMQLTRGPLLIMLTAGRKLAGIPAEIIFIQRIGAESCGQLDENRFGRRNNGRRFTRRYPVPCALGIAVDRIAKGGYLPLNQ